MLSNAPITGSSDRLAPDAETPIAPGAVSPARAPTDRPDGSLPFAGPSGMPPQSGTRAKITKIPESTPAIDRAFAEAKRVQDEVASIFDQRGAAASVLAQWQQSTEDLTRRQDGAHTAAMAAGREVPEDRRLTKVTAEQKRVMDRFGQAALAAVDAADRSLREHRQLAATATAAADAARSAYAADTQVFVKRRMVTGFEKTERLLLHRLSELHEKLAACSDRYRDAVEGAVRDSDFTRPQLLKEEHDMRDVGLEIMTREAALTRTQQMRNEARDELPSLEAQAASAHAFADKSGQTHTAQIARTSDADLALREAIASRNAVQDDADAGLQRLRQLVTALCVALRPAAPAEQTGAPDVQQMADRWRGHLHAVRSRVGPARGEMTMGPLTLTSVAKKPTRLRDAPLPSPSRRPTSTAGMAATNAIDAIDAKTRTAKADAARLLAGGKGSTPPVAGTLSPFGFAVDFTDEVRRLFEDASSSKSLAAMPAATHLAHGLLDHPPAGPGARTDGHLLRHEQALLIASVLRSVTSDPAQAIQVYRHLWHDPAPDLPGLTRRPAGTLSPMQHASHPDEASPSANVQNLAQAARRALAATSGGMEALLELQGLSLPPENSADRLHAERAVEHYTLALRAEDALIALQITPQKFPSTATLRDAIRAREEKDHLLDPAWLGTGNARRGQRDHEAEDPTTLASQAFLYATDNMSRSAGDAELHPTFKPAYAALRHGLTQSGQGSDFHLMAKYLRKFVTSIDLACKSTVSDPVGILDFFRHPQRTGRRLLGRDKTPLKTLLQAGPLGSDLGTLKGGTQPPARAMSDADLRRLQEDFDRGTVPERRQILRQVLNAVVTGGDMAEYSQGRKFGIAATVGVGVARIPGVGSVTVGITPVVEVNVDRTRAAVLKAGVSSNSGVIYMGSERKWAGSVGAGGRAGLEVGPAVNLTVQAMARLGGAHLASRGLMIRTTKRGEEHKDLPDAQAARTTSANWQRMGELVVNAIFDIADLPPESRPKHGGEMWSMMVDRLGDYRDISFGWNQGKAQTASVAPSADATAGVGMGLGFGLPVTGTLGLKHTFFDRAQARDTAGAVRAVQTSSASRTAAGLGGGIVPSIPALALESFPQLSMFSRFKLGFETEFLIQSTTGAVRLTTSKGKVDPDLSFKHRDFGVEKEFVDMVDSQRPLWEAHLGERDVDGTLYGGQRKLNDFLDDVARLAPGPSRVFGERKRLTPAAADTINACMDRMAVLERTPQDAGSVHRIQALQAQIAALVGDESSWQPDRLFVSETNQASREASGGIDLRASPGAMRNPAAGPQGFAERFMGGGKVTLGGRVDTAQAGRDLLMLDALPALPWRTAGGAGPSSFR